MKTKKHTWPVSFLIILFLLFSASGCRNQKLLKQNTSTVNIDSLKQVFKKLTEINGEIKDRTSFYLPDVKTGSSDCDSICNSRIREMLNSINREIESGNNRYQLLYNEHNKTLEVLAQIAATKSENIEQHQQEFKQEKKEVVTEVPVYIIPIFYKYSAYFGWVSALFLINYLLTKLKSWLPKKLFT
ncbi:hypothetical protein Q763_01420 [Flavobacterium beibuense F44-8]|uniref:Lipoprotein n=1 Tax=Flavobacterium beibuense F44-8 TaxID=1406840 RepID=A0A0A2M809_9FLAO|nr:hypothetical protein [Flavobacterium beibuense]KGO84430.1 hypothetical protein Q763_01420 [Flavobacterium beibuense F44-8]